MRCGKLAPVHLILIIAVIGDLADGRRQIIGFHYAGDFLGVNCHGHYGFGVEAAIAISLLAFGRRELEQLIEKTPKIRHMLLSDAFNELAAAQDRILLLGQKLTNERVASFLLMLARRQGARTADSVNILQIPVRGIDVADYLGLTQETVSRCLCTFQREGIIRAYHSRREVEIVSREKVENLSGGHSR
jgi:CRP/FNR family transcriptional regulator